MTRHIIGVDFGGTHLRAALVNEHGEILEQVKQETRAQLGPERVIDRIAAAVQDMARHLADGDSPVLGIGVVAPGPLDPFKGIILKAPNLPGWEDIPLASELRERTGLPVWAGNDANLAALAEHRYGQGRGLTDLIYLTVSTGIGSGMIINNRLLLGYQGLAGEAGHVQVIPDGPLCGCGNRGCVESVASGTNIAIEAEARLQRGLKSSLSTLGRPPTAKDVSEAAEQGDEMSVYILRRAGRFVGITAANLIHIFNPQRIIIGGGVSNAGDLLLEPMRAACDRHVMEAYRGSYDIVRTQLGDRVGLLGAAALGFSSYDSAD